MRVSRALCKLWARIACPRVAPGDPVENVSVSWTLPETNTLARDQRETMVVLLSLPDGLIEHALISLTARDLVRLAQSCRSCNALVRSAARLRIHELSGQQDDANQNPLPRLHFYDLLSARPRSTITSSKRKTFVIRKPDGRAFFTGWFPIMSQGWLMQAVLTGTEAQLAGVQQSVPAPVQGLDQLRVVEASAGHSHVLFLMDDQHAWSYGSNNDGELGHGHRTALAKPQPIRSLENERIAQVSAGVKFSLLLSAPGRVYSCGHGPGTGHGLYGLAVTLTPRPIQALQDERSVQVSTGKAPLCHAFAVTDSGRLFAWGHTNNGQLGIGYPTGDGMDLMFRSVPNLVQCPAKITQVSAGGGHTLIVTSAGGLYSFGGNEHGQLGHGDVKERWVPQAVAALAHLRVREVAAGCKHSVVLTKCGQVFTFGDGADGSLGLGNDKNNRKPNRVRLARDQVVIEVAAGDATTFMRLASGEVLGCGDGEQGALGRDRGPGHLNLWWRLATVVVPRIGDV